MLTAFLIGCAQVGLALGLSVAAIEVTTNLISMI
jgi:hypothetical protein